MINFWHKYLHEYDDQGAAVMRLPAAAKVQLGDPGVYPWAQQCANQVKEMGQAALAHVHPNSFSPKVTAGDILEAVAELRYLVVHDVMPIQFAARRKPKRPHDHSMDD